MGVPMLDLVRQSLKRRYGPRLWASLVGGAKSAGGDEANPGTREGGPLSAEPMEDGDAPSDALACWLGRQAVPRIARRHPDLFGRHRDLRSFLVALDGRTAAPGPEDEPPLAVHVAEAPDGDLLISVEGRGSCCALVEGVIAGAADHFGESALLELLKCRKRGDNRCVTRVAFQDVGARARGVYFVPLSAAAGAEPAFRAV